MGRESSLHSMVQNHTADDVHDMIVMYGKDILHKLDAKKQTPLHISAAQGNDGVVELLLVEGADVNAVDEKGLTPLHCAAKHGFLGRIPSGFSCSFVFPICLLICYLKQVCVTSCYFMEEIRVSRTLEEILQFILWRKYPFQESLFSGHCKIRRRTSVVMSRILQIT